jgi:hypothetical protein
MTPITLKGFIDFYYYDRVLQTTFTKCYKNPMVANNQHFDKPFPHMKGRKDALHSCRLLQEPCNSSYVNHPSSSRISLGETPGDKPEGSMAARIVGAAMELSGFSLLVSLRRRYRSLKVGLRNSSYRVLAKGGRQVYSGIFAAAVIYKARNLNL